MTSPIEISHPAPLRFVRHGKRRIEGDCCRIRTQAVLVEADSATFRPLGVRVGQGDGKVELLEHEGRLWIPLRVRDETSRMRPATVAEVAEWMVDRSTSSLAGPDLMLALAGTPLVQSRIALSKPEPTGWHLPWRHSLACGMSDGFVPRSVAFDGAEMARTALRTFLAEDLRIAGDAVFRRVSPVAFYQPRDPQAGWPNRIHLDIPSDWQPGGFDLMVRPDRIREAVEDHTIQGPPPSDPEIEAIAGAIPAHLLDDGDLLRLANLGARMAVGIVDGLGERRLVDRRVQAAMLERVEPLRVDALLGEISGVRREDAEPAILRAASALKAIADAYPTGPETSTAHRFCRHVEERVIPRFDAPLGPDEVAALGAA